MHAEPRRKTTSLEIILEKFQGIVRRSFSSRRNAVTMKCPACGHPKMVAKTQDENLSYGNQSLTLHAMHGDFCPGCGEGVWDAESYRRYTEAQASLLRGEKGDLSAENEAEIEKHWVDEAICRDEELDSGGARAYPADEVLTRARARRK